MLREAFELRITGTRTDFDARLRSSALPWKEQRIATPFTGELGRFETDRVGSASSFRVRQIGRRRGAGKVTAWCALEGAASATLRVRTGIGARNELFLLFWVLLVAAGLTALVMQELGRTAHATLPPWVALPALPFVLAGLVVLAIRSDAAKLRRFLESVCDSGGRG